MTSFPRNPANLVVVSLVSILIVSCGLTDAFMSPQTFVGTYVQNQNRQVFLENPNTKLNMIPNNGVSTVNDFLSASTSLALSDDAQAVAQANSALEGVRTFFIIITAVVFGLAGLTFVTAAFIVPQAASRLEEDTKRIKPGLWEEYEAKLLEGETMAQRPDLLQELGKIMQPLIIADFEESADAKGTAPVKKDKNIVDNGDQWSD